jgi:predicted dehydrogenase
MPNTIKIGLIGVGRGGPSSYHARSFSSIINGFDRKKVPPNWPTHSIFVENARIEAVWDEDQDAVRELAEVFEIPRVEKRMEDTANDVDGVIIVDDITMTHQKKAPFFIDNGVPTFIDKPLSNDLKEASALIELAEKRGTLLMSTSALRYAKEIENAQDRIKAAGPIHFVSTICQGQYVKEENLIHYGIHPLELAYSVLGSGVEYVQNFGEKEKNVVKIAYRDGKVLMLIVFPKITQIFELNIYGEQDAVSILVEDWDYFYWNMLQTFVQMVVKKKMPVPLSETLEIIKVLLLSMESLAGGGKRIVL